MRRARGGGFPLWAWMISWREHIAATEVGAKPCAPAFGEGTAVRAGKPEGELVPDEAHDALAGRWGHYQLLHPAKKSRRPCRLRQSMTEAGSGING